MSARKIFKPHSYSNVQAQSSLFLPFLYCTPTILSAPPSTRPSRTAPGHRPVHRSFCSLHQKQAPNTDYRQDGHIPFERDSLPSSGTSQFQPLDAYEESLQPRPPRSSTITASEQAVFDRIFKDMAQQKPTEDEPDEDEDLDYDSDPLEDLNEIFEKAIGMVQKQEEQNAYGEMRSRLRFASNPFQRALDDPTSEDRPQYISRVVGQIGRAFTRPLQFTGGRAVDVVAPQDEDEESLSRLRRACDEHLRLIRDKLERTTTDVEIWSLLENEVFSLIPQLDLQSKAEVKAKKAGMDSATRKKQPKAPSRLKKKDSSSSSTLDILASRGYKVFELISANTLLSLLQINYAYYNLYAVRLLRRRHPSSPYALHVLPHLKSLGPISYVLGASAGLYNEVLFIKWTQYSDVHGIADLMQEMVNQGVESNNVTLSFLAFIDKTRRAARSGAKGPVVQAWWELRSVREGWRRVRSFYDRFRNDAVQTEMKMEEERMEARERADIKTHEVRRAMGKMAELGEGTIDRKPRISPAFQYGALDIGRQVK